MSDGISATVSGGDALAAAVGNALRDIDKSAQLALVVEAAAVAADAKRRCPVGATGNLRASIRIEPEKGGAAVVCGGPSAPYAVEVHERTDIEHQNGEAKFLEHALQQAAGNLAEHVASRVKAGG